MRTVLLALAAGLLAATGASAQDTGPRSVVELFTSQGCSSCPPADRLAGEVAKDSSALVLTLPVDYWDYLGWKDTLGSPAHTARQRAYAMVRGDRKVYTPQIVVNGREATLGGDSAAVFGAVKRADGSGGLPLPVGLKLADGRIEVSVASPAGKIEASSGEVWILALERSREVRIGKGENAGRMATYVNVVRHMTRLGAWTGTPTKFDLPADEAATPSSDAFAVIVQAGSGGRPGAILGAAQVDQARAAPTATSHLTRDSY